MATFIGSYTPNWVFFRARG
ncbi:hypothetical protein [Bartonella krasnovii]